MTNMVEPKIILKVMHGSHAYGLSTPESDVDWRSVAVESFSQHVSLFNSFEQKEEHMSNGFPVDHTIFGLKKFLKLAIDSNPNVIEILFVEPENIELVTELGEDLLSIRESFLSKKAYHTFGSYARGQLKRLENQKTHI